MAIKLLWLGPPVPREPPMQHQPSEPSAAHPVSAAADHAALPERPHTALSRLQATLHANPTLVPLLVLLASVAAFGLIAGGRFFHPFNLSLIIQQVAIIGMLAVAQSLVVLTAGIDLSVAAIMVLASVVMGKLAVELAIPAPVGY